MLPYTTVAGLLAFYWHLCPIWEKCYRACLCIKYHLFKDIRLCWHYYQAFRACAYVDGLFIQKFHIEAINRQATLRVSCSIFIDSQTIFISGCMMAASMTEKYKISLSIDAAWYDRHFSHILRQSIIGILGDHELLFLVIGRNISELLDVCGLKSI